MFVESLIGLIAVIALVVVAVRQQNRIGLIERELGALRSLVLSGAMAPASPRTAAETQAEAAAVAAAAPERVVPTEPADAAAMAARVATVEPVASAAPVSTSGSPADPSGTETAAAAGPWQRPAAAPQQPAAAQPTQPAQKPDIETALGTRWAVWVGGLALALGGIFLIRYTIEAGIFGPEVRLALAGLFGVVLLGAGEFIRRTGFKVPVEGAAGAYIPAILTAAGAFVLFGTVYSAHGIYGFIGAGPAFVLLGLIGVATIALSLVHGQALAGIGLLGAFVTPVLVSSQSPNAWALFGYLAIVLVATAAIARLRDWKLLMAAAFFGMGGWTIVYMGDAPQPDLAVVLFANLVTLGSLGFIWLSRRDDDADGLGFDWPSIVPGFFLGLGVLMLFVNVRLAEQSGHVYGTALVLAMLAVALLRPLALPVLHVAGIATALAFFVILPFDALSMVLYGDQLILDGMPSVATDAPMRLVGALLGVVFAAAGFWSARRWAASHPVRAASWAGWGVAVPLVVLGCLWLTFGNIDRDLFYAALALLLVVVAAAGGEWIARAEEPAQAGGPAVSFALGGAGLAALLMLHMAFGSALTTIFAGALAVVPALATRVRSWPVLGWLSVGAVIAVMTRVAVDPTIVGAANLQTTPVFNWLLPGYGIPALAFTFAAWQLARTTDGRPRLVMEAGAVLFALLTAAMLTRHAMNGGVIDASEPTLAEQAIYTLLALGAGAILVAIDMRSPSSVLRYSSIAAGVVSAVMIVLSHFLFLNPLFTEESTGQIPVFNLLLLGYLLPAVAALGLAWYARDKRPMWYSAMLALIGAALALAYATLSVRRLFQGEFIGLWKGMEQLETYSYSALWLVMGVGLLVAGVRFGSQVLRIASAGLITIAVAKVFLFDMSELEGVLRALSFIGLGAVLIGIGLFYQRLLRGAAKTSNVGSLV